MKINSLILILAFLSAATVQASSVLAPICSKVHGPKILLDRFSIQVLKIQNGKKMDTTSLRQEMKFVVDTALLNQKFDELRARFGSKMKKRDQAPAGFSNVTSTLYLTTAKYKTLKGEIKKAKVRFRKYYLRSLSDPRDLRMAKGMEDRSWLELKIQHPYFPNVVTKPRLTVLDRDIRYFTTDIFFQHREALEKRLLTLNPGKEDEVSNAIKFFTELYSNPDRKVQNLFAKTEYDRDSESIKLGDDKTKIDVQFTSDANINLTRLADKQTFNVYGRDQTVIEVKIPVFVASFTPEILAAHPDLVVVKELVQWLTEQHDRQFPINKGKMSKIRKDGYDKKDEDNQHFLDVLDDLGGS